MPKTGDSSSGRSAVGLPLRRGFGRRFGPKLILLATLILVVDALVGDKGLLERVRERQRHHDVQLALQQLQHENSALREQARRLREEDPTTIEDAARRQLGMIKPGEMLFIVKDLDKPGASAPAHPDAAPGSATSPGTAATPPPSTPPR
jgi:cell division protein FtsB